MVSTLRQKPFLFFETPGISQNPVEAASRYPQLRIMGSKYRLLPWLYDIFSNLKFETALDGFCGSGSVAYLLKVMGKSVVTNDYLQFPYHIANGLIANSAERISEQDEQVLSQNNPDANDFIYTTFKGIFYTEEDLHFLDNAWASLRSVPSPYKRSLILTALFRAALKKQPRGVFTVGNEVTAKYNDGRRDLQISFAEHVHESFELLNSVIFDNGRTHAAYHGSVFDLQLEQPVDLAYFDPPYVPRSDDNDYIKRYHFLEGLACYWEGLEIMDKSKVRKIKKVFTPFAYRRTSEDAFDQLFRKFAESTIILSYSSNGYPDKEVLVKIMQRYKRRVTVEENDHRYHFGTHKGVRPERAVVKEYLIIGEQ